MNLAASKPMTEEVPRVAWTNAEQQQYDDTLHEIASALAECLQTCDFSRDISCELERKGIYGLAILDNLTSEEAFRNVLDLLEANSWIVDVEASREVPEEKKGDWTIGNISANISNEDH